MNAKQIVNKWLRDNEYDGLCCDGCGCSVDDLMPCEDYCLSCVPAKKTLITERNKSEYDVAEIGQALYIPAGEERGEG